MNRPTRPLIRIAVATTLSLGAAGPGRAQDAPDAAPALEEIVVTAQKREQNLNDVGISISVVSGDDLERRRIEDVDDLAGYVPNMNVKNTLGATNPVVTIRGIGLNDFSSNNNPTVGVYVDEVFLTSTAMMGFQLFDMERVEVLKGPQGTLYGRNTTAGAVSFVTRGPTREFAGHASLTYGDYQSLEVEGAIGGPLGDAIAFRLAGKVQNQGEGFSTNRATGADFGAADVAAWRAELTWDPGERLTVDLNVHGGRNRSNSYGIEHFGTQDPATFDVCPAILDGRIDPTSCVDFFGYSDPDGDPYVGDYDRVSRVDVDSLGSVLRVEAALGSMQLTSVSGYEQLRRKQAEDFDASVMRSLNSTWDANIDQYSQELRLSSQSTAVDWVTGLFYSYDTVDTGAGNRFDSQDLLLTVLSTDWTQRTQSLAAFGHAEWPLSDALHLVTGLRFTWEEKEFEGGTTDLNPLGASCILDPACNPGFVGPYPLTSTDAKIDDTDLSGKIGLDYKASPDWLLYGSIGKGFKSGGFFGGITFSAAELAPFAAEELVAYEAGFKGRLAADTLQLTGAVFYYDYSDIQTFTMVSTGELSVLKLGNVDHASAQGFDFDLWWRPLGSLELRVGVGYAQTELGPFAAADGPQPAGNELPNAPQLTLDYSLAYDWMLDSGLALGLSIDGSYTDAVFKEALNIPYLAASDYWLTNARLALASADRRWELAAWGHNLANEAYVTDAFDNGIGNGVRLYGQPRTCGLSFTYRWNE